MEHGYCPASRPGNSSGRRQRPREAGYGAGLVRKGRLELPRVAPLAPKASASTNSATFAARRLDSPAARGPEGGGLYHAPGVRWNLAKPSAAPRRAPEIQSPDREFCWALVQFRQREGRLERGARPDGSATAPFVGNWVAAFFLEDLTLPLNH